MLKLRHLTISLKTSAHSYADVFLGAADMQLQTIRDAGV